MISYKLISSLILYIISTLNISFLLDIKIKNKLYIILLGLPIFLLTGYIPSNLRIIIQSIILLLINRFFFKDIKKIISAIIYNYFITILVDIIITSLFFIIIKDKEYIEIVNYLIIIIWGLLSYITIRQKIFTQFFNIIKNKLSEYMYILITLFLVICYISIIDIYTLKDTTNIIFYLIAIFILTISLFNLMKKTIERAKIEQRINELTKFMKVYEKEIEQQIINQHEYKNMLLCVKSMIAENNDEAIKFIDNILENKTNNNYSILKEVQKLQISTLKGLLYYKLCFCKEKGINYVLNIDSNIKYQKVKKIDTNTINNLSTIFGVLIDNAIEACLETESKNISIYIYEEKERVVFQISNTFKGTINIDFIYNKGYSTKGKKHGYGFALVKYKLKESPSLSLKTEINNDIFIQYLKLNLKNTYKD